MEHLRLLETNKSIITSNLLSTILIVNYNNLSLKMIRIIYNWKVQDSEIDAFIATWKKTTNYIHENVKGARGSFMLQAEDDSTEIKTIARWDSLEDWKRFWKESNPVEMQSMRKFGERISVEIFKEIGDFTK